MASRVPGMRSRRPQPPALGEEVEGRICEDCLMPTCPHCATCMVPIWPLPMSFQCECGFSAVLDDTAAPELREAYASLWADGKPDPFDLAHDLGIDPFRETDGRLH